MRRLKMVKVKLAAIQNDRLVELALDLTRIGRPP
jgi:hypothetical protein